MRATTLGKLVAALALLLLAGSLIAAKPHRRAHKGTAKKPAPVAKQSATPAPQQDLLPTGPWKEPPRIPLQRDLRFTVRPTLLGLVPPPDDTGDGECFVRVLGTEPLELHYEIKEQHEEPLGTSRTQDVTTIRRGEIGVARQTPQLEPPLLWTNGGWTSATGLLWLSRDTFSELKSSGSAVFDLNLPDGSGNQELAQGLNKLVAGRREAYGLRDGDPTQLIVQDWQVGYPAYVNGRRASLPAIRCTDSVRLADYWILDDPDNPLVLKMTYIAPSLAQTDPPKPAEKPATAKSKAHESRDTVQPPPPAPALDPVEELINAGGGYAVVNIDF